MALNENIVREQDARISKMVHTPTFLVVAGALPGLFAATSLENGLMIGLVTAAAIVVMASIAPLLRAFTGAWSRTAVMLMVSVTVVTLLGFGVRVTDPVVFEALGIYLPLITTNCAVLGAATINADSNYTVPEATVFGLCSGIGFALALLLFSSLRERLDLAEVPKPFQGTPIALITAGILAMAFVGFSGLC